MLSDAKSLLLVGRKFANLFAKHIFMHVKIAGICSAVPSMAQGPTGSCNQMIE